MVAAWSAGSMACIVLLDQSLNNQRDIFNNCNFSTGSGSDDTFLTRGQGCVYVAMDFYGGSSDSDDVTLYALHNLAEAGNADGIAALISSSIIVSQDPSVRPPLTYTPPPLLPPGSSEYFHFLAPLVCNLHSAPDVRAGHAASAACMQPQHCVLLGPVGSASLGA